MPILLSLRLPVISLQMLWVCLFLPKTLLVIWEIIQLERTMNSQKRIIEFPSEISVSFARGAFHCHTSIWDSDGLPTHKPHSSRFLIATCLHYSIAPEKIQISKISWSKYWKTLCYDRASEKKNRLSSVKKIQQKIQWGKKVTSNCPVPSIGDRV